MLAVTRFSQKTIACMQQGALSKILGPATWCIQIRFRRYSALEDGTMGAQEGCIVSLGSGTGRERRGHDIMGQIVIGCRIMTDLLIRQCQGDCQQEK